MDPLTLLVLLALGCGAPSYFGTGANAAAIRRRLADFRYGKFGELCREIPFDDDIKDDNSIYKWPLPLRHLLYDETERPLDAPQTSPGCLSNIAECSRGFSALVKFTPDPAYFFQNVTSIDFVPLFKKGDWPDLMPGLAIRLVHVVLSNELSRQTGDFEVRIQTGIHTWTASFRALLGYPILVGVTWRQDIGLDAYVDGVCIGSVSEPSARENVVDGGVPFMPADTLRFADFLWPVQTLNEMDGEDELLTYYLGCLDLNIYSNVFLGDKMSFPLQGIVWQCRKYCWQRDHNFAFVSDTQCACGSERATTPESAPPRCGSTCPGYTALPCGTTSRRASVYLSTSLRKGTSDEKHANVFDQILQSHIADGMTEEEVRDQHKYRRRYRRSATSYEEESESGNIHHRTRRSAEFIEVGDILGLSGESVNVTYLMHSATDTVTCAWDFGDGSTPETQTEADRKSLIPHAFSNPGSYTIDVNCGTIISDTAKATITDSLGDATFSMQQTGQTPSPSEDVTLTVTLSSGTWPSGLTFTLNGKESPFIGTGNTFMTTWDPHDFGTFLLNATLSNGIEQDITLNANVMVGVTISGLQISSPGTAGTDKPVAITVSLTTGTGVTLNVDFGNGNTVPDEALVDNAMTWTQTYTSAGEMIITATASNALGSITDSVSLLIKHSIKGLQLSANPDDVDVNDLVTASLSTSGIVQSIENVSCTIYTGDGRQFVDADITLTNAYLFSSQFNYSVVKHEGATISATCENDVSNETVEVTIAVGRTIQSCTIQTPVGLKISEGNGTVISVQGGYDISVTVDFGDGSTEMASSDVPGDIEVTHMYSATGEYNISATASNAVTSSLDCSPSNATVVVQENVPAATHFTLTAYPSTIDLTTTERINFTLTLDSSQPLTDDIFVTFLFSEHCTCSLSIPLLSHDTTTAAIYNVSGSFLVTAIIANRVSAVVKQIYVSANYPLSNFSMTPTSDVILAVGEDLTVTVSPGSGTEIKTNVTWGDGTTDGNQTEDAVMVTFSHAFQSPGTYSVCTTVRNDLLETPLEECINAEVLYPVANLLITSEPLIITSPAQSIIKISLQPGANVPTQMTCSVDYGDSTITPYEDIDVSLPLLVPMNEYSVRVQNYRAVVNCSNLLGAVEYPHVVQVKKPIDEIFELQLLEKFLWLEDNGTTAHVTLSVKDGEKIPFGKGTFLWNNGSGNILTEHKELDSVNTEYLFSFQDEGAYVLSVNISYYSGLWQGSVETDLTIAEERSFDVEVQVYEGGQWMSGQGPNFTWFHKDKELKFSPIRPYSDSVYRWDYGGQTNGSGHTFQHTYSNVGVYALRAYAIHPLYEDSRVIFIHITSGFDFTDVDIIDSGNKDLKLKAYSKLNMTLEGDGLDAPLCILWVFCNETLYFSGPPNCYNAPYDYYEPGLVWTADGQVLTHVEFNTPGEYNITIIISNNIDVDQHRTITLTITGCVRPPMVSIQGAAQNMMYPKFSYRSDYVRLSSTVSLECYGLEQKPLFQWATYDMDTDEAKDLDSENYPNYDFPPRTFPVGFYNVTMTVTITETSPPLSGYDYTYMRINASALVVTISGGIARTVNGLKNITLDASESIDPDVTTQNFANWTFIWRCERGTQLSTPVPTVPSASNAICESDSMQRIPNETEMTLTLRLAVNAEYKFEVEGVLGSRSTTFPQTIITVDGDPVVASIICKQNCLSKVNPTSPLGYEARCENCDTKNATFRWEMQKNEVKVNLADIAETDLTKSGLLILADKLEGGQSYTIWLYMQEPGKREGFTAVKFFTNLTPRGGSCQISPTIGEALTTDFTASCEHWEDEGEEKNYPGRNESLPYVPSLRYRVEYRNPGDSVYTQLVSGESLVMPGLKMKAGLEANNFTFEVRFTILDKYDGKATINTTVQVTKANVNKEKIDDLLKPGGLVSQLVQSKDVEAGIRFISVVVDISSEVNMTEAEQTELKNTIVPITTNMSAEAKSAGDILMFAGTYKNIFKAGSPPPDASSTAKVAGSINEMTDTYQNLPRESSEDKKRTTDAMVAVVGNIVAKLGDISEPSATEEEEDEEAVTEATTSNMTDKAYEQMMISNMLQDVLNSMVDLVLRNMVPGQEPVVSKTETIEASLLVESQADMGNKNISANGSEIRMPSAEELFGDGVTQDSVQLKAVTMSGNPFSYANNGGDISSPVVSLSFQSESANKIDVSNTTSPIRIVMKTQPEQVTEVNLTEANLTQKDPMSYHGVDVDEDYIDIRAVVLPEREGQRFWVFIRLLRPPQLDRYYAVKKLPREVSPDESWENETLREESRYTFSMTKSELCGKGKYVIGIMPAGTDAHFDELNSTVSGCNRSSYNETIPLPKNENNTVTPLAYWLSIYFSSCRYFDEEAETWSGKGCESGVQTTRFQTECLCNHLTSFASTFYVPVNTIDFNTVFDKSITDNALVFGTVVGFAGVYLLLLIYARRKDKQDIVKWGVTPMSDNHPAHTYAYQITVETGVRPGAGTKSKVGIIVTGEEADSGSRVLEDSKRPIFQVGSINSFLMTVPRPLGLLTYVRIWHDNSGGGGQAGWFLSRISIMDLQTGKEFFFLCEQWLAVEQGDGAVDRTLFVASKKDMIKVGQLVYTSGRKNLSDQHLWFSIFSRPTRSQFNRCQRLCCCLTLLYTSMIANALFWRSSGDERGSRTIIRIAGINVDPKQIYIGIISSLVVMPVNMIIVQIFRKSRPLEAGKPDPLYDWFRRKFKGIKARCTSNAHKKLDQYNYEEKQHGSPLPEKEQEKGASSQSSPTSEDEQSSSPTGAELAAKKKYPMPHWMVYVAYVIAFLANFVSCFFIVLYSLQWGKEQSQEWLVSMVTSFFSSALLIQPMKVIVIVFIVSIIFKKPSKMNDVEVDDLKDKSANGLQTDEEYLHEESLTAGKAPAYTARPATPPSKQFLQEARKQRLRDIQMLSILRDVLLYAFFLGVVLTLCYTNRDPAAFFMSESIRNIFVSEHVDYLVDGDDPASFSSLSQSTPEAFWDYVEQRFIPGLYGDRYYNGENMLPRDTNYLRDWQSYRVGPARLRQLRVKPLPCDIADQMVGHIDDCTLEYSWSNQDEGMFAENWTYTCDPTGSSDPIVNSVSGIDETKPWRYQSASALNGLPHTSNSYIYSGGGYVAQFGTTRDEAIATAQYLRERGWYDKYTRAIFLEFTVYNANVNLFSVVTLLVETPTEGGGIVSNEIHTFRLYQYIGALWIISLGLQGIFCIYLVYFLAHFIYRLKKEGRKELKNFWSILELSMLVVGIGAVAMFAMRQLFIKFTSAEVKEKPDYFVNFSHIAKWDQLFGFLLAILAFCGVLRFMRVLRMSSRATQIAQALHLASRDMFYFLLMWFIILLAFGLWAYAVFSRSVDTFHTFQATFESLLSLMLGSFDFYALQAAERYVGPIFFFIYIFTVYFILSNMLITIIVEAFMRMKSDPDDDSTFSIMGHLWRKLKLSLASYGIGSNSVGAAPKKPQDGDKVNDENSAEEDGPTYEDMMSTIEKRVDQLITYVIKNYGENVKGGAIGSKASLGSRDGLNSFEAMVQKDIENARQKKVRNIMIS
ncbi:polycystin family receptor for egg jelly-like [Diadema setosum]|uniref:polycystin family receptor for egg jelly-like n=1 Tax=Diadema setosum TaxID=31175 RepID=UPI003B3AE7AC